MMFETLLKVLQRGFDSIGINAYFLKNDAVGLDTDESIYWTYEFDFEAQDLETSEIPVNVICTCFSRIQDPGILLQQVEKAKAHFQNLSADEKGIYIRIWNNGGHVIPSGQLGLDKFEIYLSCKIWKGSADL